MYQTFLLFFLNGVFVITKTETSDDYYAGATRGGEWGYKPNE